MYQTKANRCSQAFQLAYLLPSLALIWPIVNFVNSNRTLFLTDTLSTSLAWGMIGSLTLWAFVWRSLHKVAKPVATRASFSLTIAIIAFFSWDATSGLRTLLMNWVGVVGVGFIYVAIALSMVALAWAIGASANVIPLSATFLSVAIAIPGVSLAFFLATRGNDSPDIAGRYEAHDARLKPNVYLFISDGYPRQDVLAREFSFDNEPFLREMSFIGYRVRRDAISNYPTTYQSIATLVQMDYVSKPETPAYYDRRRFQRAITGQSAMVQRFRSLGYRFAQVTRRISGGGCRGIENICLDSTVTALDGTLSSGFLQLTPLPSLITRLTGPRPVETIWDMRSSLERIPLDQPFVSFVHTLPPHDSFFDSSCNSVPFSNQDHLSLKTDPTKRAARVATVVCVNSTILKMARWLDARDPGAVVIFLSDHGADMTVDWTRPMSEWGSAQIAERFANLLIVRMPPACAALSGAARSLVNVMEVVFACIEGREPALRKDRVFVGAYEVNPDYGHVREVTNYFEAVK